MFSVERRFILLDVLFCFWTVSFRFHWFGRDVETVFSTSFPRLFQFSASTCGRGKCKSRKSWLTLLLFVSYSTKMIGCLSMYVAHFQQEHALESHSCTSFLYCSYILLQKRPSRPKHKKKTQPSHEPSGRRVAARTAAAEARCRRRALSGCAFPLVLSAENEHWLRRG